MDEIETDYEAEQGLPDPESLLSDEQRAKLRAARLAPPTLPPTPSLTPEMVAFVERTRANELRRQEVAEDRVRLEAEDLRYRNQKRSAMGQLSPQGKYPWEFWTNGETHVAVRGEDFWISLPNFRTMLYQRGQSYDMRVVTKKVSKDEIEFTFFPMGE